MPDGGKPDRDELTYIIQKALNDWGETYQPSPGQLMDHVHHRVADIAVQALEAAGIRMLGPLPCYHEYWGFKVGMGARTWCRRCGIETTHFEAMGS